MDKSPLIADVQTPIETLAAQAVESGNKTLADGFIIVDGSRFVGVGSGLDLMHLLVDLQTEKNRQVMQSIDYASAIQKGMLGESLKSLQSTLSDAAIIWEPRDVVGGDFYHFQAFPNGWFAAIADCTGHGVPGAFLTLIASSSLRHALDRHGPENPAFLLAEVSLGIKLALGQHDTQAQTGLFNDGADAVFMWFDANQNTLTSAHAKMALFILPEGSENLITLNGERLGLGYTDTPARAVWKNHTTELTANTLVLACTDGLIDQIGGAKHIAFGKRRVRQALLQHRTLSAPALLESLMATLSQYQGTQARRDDLTLFGFRPNPN
ncbi:MAG TPA: protein-serine/threonine phosphatase [Pusillimonas sp.]|nr:protein-serine/threonine phosphatase [Pusillimonas sp.]